MCRTLGVSKSGYCNRLGLGPSKRWLENQVWVSDITYIQTKQGWVYLTVIIDLFHRKVVGWSMSRTLSTGDTITPAWNMAVRLNSITEELIFHSDKGTQYASYRFTNILKVIKDL